MEQRKCVKRLETERSVSNKLAREEEEEALQHDRRGAFCFLPKSFFFFFFCTYVLFCIMLCRAIEVGDVFRPIRNVCFCSRDFFMVYVRFKDHSSILNVRQKLDYNHRFS